MSNMRIQRKICLAALLFLPISMPLHVKADASVHSIPDTKAAKYLGEKRVDAIKEITGNETIARYYEKKDGTRFALFIIRNKHGRERVYSVNIDTDGKAPFEYTLVDLEGNGRFTKLPMRKTKTSGWITKYANSD